MTSISELGGHADSRVQRGNETKAHSFSGPVVLVFEASQHSVPHILQQHTNTVKDHCNNKTLWDKKWTTDSL